MSLAPLPSVYWAAFIIGVGISSIVRAASQEPQELTREERLRPLLQRTWEVWASPLEGELVLDGSVDEPAWELAEPVSDFYQWDRNEGMPATERTEVRVLFDEFNLYVGIRCYDTEMSKMLARAIFRDEVAAFDDLVLITIDTYNDHRSSFHFATNANGYKIDAVQTGENPNTRNINWDAVWDSAGQRHPDRWDVEVVVPFKSLRFEAPPDGEEVIFGIGFKRNIRRKNEEDIWPFVSNDSSWYRPAELGHLRGLSKARPGRNVEVRPYVLGQAERELIVGREEADGDIGVDAKWGITPGMTADFTINTDFAQAEADVQQINFTRFSLFFPEKRQFFLEGERMFEFGLPQEADLVFTRRIGLSRRGEVIPILAGARLSGREGPYSIGAMNIQTKENGPVPAENFTVLRLRRDILNRSSVGAVFTNRQGGGHFNRVYGIDASFLLKDAWLAEGFLGRTDDDLGGEGRDARYLRAAYDTDLWGASYRYLDLGEDFRPGIGFVRRPDSRENYAEVKFSPRPSAEFLRQIHMDGSLRYVTNQLGTLETRDRRVGLSNALESGDTINVGFTNRLEVIDAPFALLPGLIIAPGTYEFNFIDLGLTSYRGRPGQLFLGFSRGGFWDGERTLLSVGGRYRQSKPLLISGDWEINWLDFPQGSFVTHLISSRIQVAFRRDVVLLSLLQYNSDTDLFSANIRFNWIPKPGTDLFVIYNELDEWGGRLSARNRSLIVKLVYLFTF